MPKANYITITGNNCQISGENWNDLQRKAYTSMSPMNDWCKASGVPCSSSFKVTACVPGQSPVTCVGVFYRGCTAMAVSPEMAKVL